MRIPLALVFPFTVGRPFVALAIVAAAALSDVLDGWAARRLHGVTAAGAVMDPVTDKVFVFAVVLTLLFTQRVSLGAALLIGTRDILEIPLVAATVAEPQLLADRTGEIKANGFGKAVTVIQFAAIVAALTAPKWVGFLAACAALSGSLAAASYGARVLRSRRTARRVRAAAR